MLCMPSIFGWWYSMKVASALARDTATEVGKEVVWEALEDDKVCAPHPKLVISLSRPVSVCDCLSSHVLAIFSAGARRWHSQRLL